MSECDDTTEDKVRKFLADDEIGGLVVMWHASLPPTGWSCWNLRSPGGHFRRKAVSIFRWSVFLSCLSG
jgi:hypothetical protein